MTDRLKTAALSCVALVFGGCNIFIDFEECTDSAECTNGLVCRQGLCVREGSGLEPCPGRIYVKLLADLTGATSDVGVPFHKGEMDLIREINANGGIEGCTIEAESQDYAYDPVKAQEIYDRWKSQPEWDQVVTIFGWGSGDSVLLAPQVKVDRKPFLSASYFGGLASPEPVVRPVNVPEVNAAFEELSFPQSMTSDGFPFNFFAGTDYSTAARIAMFHARRLSATRVGFFYCDAAPYCRGPIPAARTYAKYLSLEIGRDLRLELTEDQETYDQKIREYFQAELDYRNTHAGYQIVDWVWGGNTTRTTAQMAIALEKISRPPPEGLGLNVQLIVNNWGFDENLYARCPGACAERVHGIMPFVAYGDIRATGMSKVTELHDKWRSADGDTTTYKNVRYVQGYVNVLLFKIAVERVLAQKKQLTGDTIKEALETFAHVSTDGLTAPISFTPRDHRPQSTETIYKFNASGQLVNEPPDRTIFVEEGWLGW